MRGEAAVQCLRSEGFDVRLLEIDAATAVRMALAGQDGPTGGFFGSHGRQPW